MVFLELFVSFVPFVYSCFCFQLRYRKTKNKERYPTENDVEQEDDDHQQQQRADRDDRDRERADHSEFKPIALARPTIRYRQILVQRPRQH